MDSVFPMAYPFCARAPLSTAFNGNLKLQASDNDLTSDAGAILLRETMERIGLVFWLHTRIIDPRDPSAINYPFSELFRTLLLMQGQGWQDLDDADTLRYDPALRLAVSGERGTAPVHEDATLASQPTMSRLMAILADKRHRSVLRQSLLEVASRRVRSMTGGKLLPQITLDVDSMPMTVHGEQVGSEYNGHYHCRMFHPLIATAAETGDILDMQLRPGNVHTADNATDFILDLLRRTRECLAEIALVRMDAGFPEDKLLSALEADDTRYLARIKRNSALDRLALAYINRHPGRPPAEPRMWFHDLTYRAKAWSRERRVVLVVKECLGELVNEYFWLLTDIPITQMDGPALLEHYRQRGTAEGHFGEYKDVLAPLLSATSRPRKGRAGTFRTPLASDPTDDPTFARNEVKMLLNALAYNLMHIGRTLIETVTGQGWSLRRFRQRLLRVAARVVTTAGCVIMKVQNDAFDLWYSLWPELAKLRPA